MGLVIQKVMAPANFNLFLFGDIHSGTRSSHRKGVTELIDKIKTPYDGVKTNFAVDHGDIAETVTRLHQHFDPDFHYLPVREQEDECVNIRKPLGKKLICILDGNHTFRMADTYGQAGGFARKVAERLGVNYGSFTTKIEFYAKSGNLMFKTFHAHGAGSINSVADDAIRRWANMKITLKRKLSKKAGDCILMCMGHTHKIITVKPQSELYLVNEGNKVVQKYTHSPNFHSTGFIHPDHRYYVNTGSLYKLYSDEPNAASYAERFFYDPLELGFVVMRVRDGVPVGLDRIIV